jgi:hypothetical protein
MKRRVRKPWLMKNLAIRRWFDSFDLLYTPDELRRHEPRAYMYNTDYDRSHISTEK